MNIRERFRPQPMDAGSSYAIEGAGMAGFLCTASTADTLTVTDADGTVLVDALPLTAGEFVAIPIFFNTSAGGTVELSATGAGTLLV